MSTSWVWVVNDNGGEGALHVVTTQAKAGAFGAEAVAYGAERAATEEEGRKGKPYLVKPAVSVGDKVFVTTLWDSGCYYAVGGVYATKAAAVAASSRLPPDIAARCVGGSMCVEMHTVE